MKLRAAPGSSCAQLLLLVLLCSCGGGGGGSGEPGFFVPAPPSSMSSEGGRNQAPPQDWLVEGVVPTAAFRPAPLTREAREQAESDALVLARSFLTSSGFATATDVVTQLVLPDEYGCTHVKLAQLHSGVPVLGGGLACHLHADRAATTTANLVRGLTLDVRPTVAMQDAVDAALARYGTRSGVALDTVARLAILPTLERVRARTAFPNENTDDFDVVLANQQLVWEVTVSPQLPDIAAVLATRLAAETPGTDTDDGDTDSARREAATRAGHEEVPPAFEELTTAILAPAVRYLYEAHTNTLLQELELSAQDDFVEETGIGHSYFSGKVNLAVARWSPTNTLYLMDIARPDPGNGAFKIGNWVLDADNVATHDVNDMYWIKDGNNSWGDGSITNSENSSHNTARRQTPAVDVAYGVQLTWDFLDHVLGRWGPAGDGTPTNACVHYDDAYGDAHYNATSRFICFGDGGSINEPGNYGLGTVAHELGHALWHAVGNGTDSAEARALNEGHGDILGGLVDLYRNTGLGQGTQVRRLENFANWRWRVVDPDGYTEKDSEGVTHTGQKYWSAGLKNKPEHVGGLPFGRAFVYLAEGAPSDMDNTLYTTEFPDGLGGIGIAKAAHIWRTAVAYYIVGTPDYATMRTAFLDAAEQLYGLTSMERKAVRRAFAAIRVGSSAPDLQNPTIHYAQVFAVNPKDMTALVCAWPSDDTGFRELRVGGYSNNGVYRGDFFLGYANIARAPAGTSSFTFTMEDSDGNTASVNRSFLKVRDRNLIVNGDMEDGSGSWSTFTGDGVSYNNPNRAFTGSRYMSMQGLNSAWQDVAIPATAKDVALVFRILIRNSTQPGEFLRVQAQGLPGGVVEQLAAYAHDTPADTRNWLNRGYLRQEFDLSHLAGQTVRITFVNGTALGKLRFLVDQIVLTYVNEVTVGLPQVQVHEWENTVHFTLPEINGLEPAEISRVDWYIDNAFVGAGTSGLSDYLGGYFLSTLGPGAHWVAGRVRGLDNAILKDTQAVWFHANPFNELLVNGGFESGAWDLTYSDPPPKILVVENNVNQTVAYDGQRALQMGGQASGATTEAGQAVQMPQQMVTLDFSVRVKVLGSEPGPPVTDFLKLELWNLATFQKIAEYPVADQSDIIGYPGDQEAWRGYVRKNVSIPPGLVQGKNILYRLKTTEDNQDPTWFFIDNASLRYTLWGVQIGG